MTKKIFYTTCRHTYMKMCLLLAVLFCACSDKDGPGNGAGNSGQNISTSISVEWNSSQATVESKYSTPSYTLMSASSDYLLYKNTDGDNGEMCYFEFYNEKLVGYTIMMLANENTQRAIDKYIKSIDFVDDIITLKGDTIDAAYFDKSRQGIVTCLQEKINDMDYYVLSTTTMDDPVDYTEHESEVISVNGHDAVDLGLSVKWATTNFGASTYSGNGSLFAWGETTTRSSEFNYWHYQHYTNWSDAWFYESHVKRIGNIDGTKYDIVRKDWGEPWTMPTRAQYQELVNRCTWISVSNDNFSGYKVLSQNGNYIYIPYITYKDNTGSRSGFIAYWSGTETGAYAYILGYQCIDTMMKWHGHPTRPVCK